MLSANGKTKLQVPTCTILGVNVAAINMDWLLKFTSTNLERLRGEYICVSNVHTTVMSYENTDYCAVQNSAVLAIPDGGPLSRVGRKRGHPQMQRTTGPSFMQELFEASSVNSYRHYFYGATEETLEKLSVELQKNYPDIQIAGMYSPPFRALTPDEDDAVIQRINKTNPDFIWVGLGAPKQENWMAEHKNKLNGVMVGVGAGFDYFAGNIKRAPEWMQKTDLEWFYRFVQEPQRLFKRYMGTNFKFIWNAMMRGR